MIKYLILFLFLVGCSNTQLNIEDFRANIIPEMKQLTEDISEVEEKHQEIVVTKNLDECDHFGNISQSFAILTAYREVGLNYYNENKAYFDRFCDETPGCDIVEINVIIWEENIDHYQDLMDDNNAVLESCGYTFTMEELLDEARVVVNNYLGKRG